MTTRRLALLGLAASAAGCYSSDAPLGDAVDAPPPDVRDTATDTRPDTVPDTTPDVSPDVSPDVAACTEPQRWEYTALPIDRFEDISDGPVVEGRSARVMAWINVGPPGCSEPGPVSVAVDPAARTATVTVGGWQNVDALAGPCPPREPQGMVAVISELTVGTWMVIDGSAGPSGDPVSMTLDVLSCDEPDCICSGRRFGEGEWCALDCQCEYGLQCVGYLGIDGTPWHACERSCSDDHDCPRYAVCTDWDDGPWRVCRDAPGDVCTEGGAECGPGERCGCFDDGHPCRCEPVMDGAGPMCCRGEECAGGQDCVLVDDARPGTSQCLVRCRSDFDCPAAMYCFRDVFGAGALPGICNWYED